MKITKKLRKSKGFTLVELLIVIIIIGILAGMMMLATGAATDKAEATKIVSNMRNVKAAAIMYYADKGTWPLTSDSTAKTEVAKYLDQQDLLTAASADYSITKGTSDDYYVTYTYNSKTTQGIKDKLGEMDSVTTATGSATMNIN